MNAPRHTPNPTRALHEAGQRLWLDSISRAMLDDGTLEHLIAAYSVTGLTSNPTLYEHAVRRGHDYDASLLDARWQGYRGEGLFFQLALEDLTRAAALLLPIHRRSRGQDGWVSLEVSPVLAYAPAPTLAQVLALHAQASLPNLFLKIPGTPPGLRAIEEAIFQGVPINVTLLFSATQSLEAADAYMRGIERRLEAGRSPRVPSVASLFVSRWDKAVEGRVPAELRNRLGIAMAGRAYRLHHALRTSPRFQRLQAEGAWMQRLLWASTGTKDPTASDVLYVEALQAPDTIDTMPEATLRAFADHGRVGPLLPEDGGDAERVLDAFGEAGVDLDGLAVQLQREGADAFVTSWRRLLACIEERRAALQVEHGDVR